MFAPIVQQLAKCLEQVERLERELAHKNWVISQQADHIVALELQRDIVVVTAKRETPALKLVK